MNRCDHQNLTENTSDAQKGTPRRIPFGYRQHGLDVLVDDVEATLVRLAFRGVAEAGG